MISTTSATLIAGYTTFTLAFLAYTFRPYLFSAVGLVRHYSHPNAQNSEEPMVSVVVPVYNEKNVIERIMDRCTSFDYSNYEVIVVDDSNDGTTEKLSKWAPRIKLVHRNTRRGWKGGAINDALRFFSNDSKYTIVLDADSIPEKDLIIRFIAKIDEGYDAVQGVQVPDLNANYSRISGATSAIQGYFQLIEQPSKGMIGLPVSITGSNFMIKTELLREFKLAEDIGEDWDLTLRLLTSGRKIAYDPSIVTRCEAPFTLGEAIKQYIRWSEGNVRGTAKHFRKIMKSDMKLISKLDIIMTGLSPLVTLLLIASSIIGAYLALHSFYFELILIPVSIFTVLSGLLTMVASSLKMGMSPLIAVFSEAIYFIFTPFSIYASIRGLALKRGSFHRTSKLGYISS
jgi:cellulose synthase/poly-beta-1,6-N-acetylglucosamine synthase-like glycosyltransferase